MMDCNKDLTMESDFEGQFNYPSSRLPNHNNPVNPAAIQSAVNSYLDKHQITNGKSAYQSAVDGGYTGTEAEFNQAFKDINMTKDEMLAVLRGGELS